MAKKCACGCGENVTPDPNFPWKRYATKNCRWRSKVRRHRARAKAAAAKK